MSLRSRFANVFQADRSRREIDEELQSHIDEAIENGRDPEEVRRAFGSPLRHRERSRDVRALRWLDSLRADAVFGWRQIRKNRATSAAVVLSLGLAIGSCMAAFRLIDALLLRPLPVANPDRLHVIQLEGFDVAGNFNTRDMFEYPLFERLRDATPTDAKFLALSMSTRGEAGFGGAAEADQVYRQYVSGTLFDVFGLKPAIGRLLQTDDDVTPGGHPVAVLSYEFWTRRFGQEPSVVGKPMRMDGRVYEVIGVVEPGFNGVEPGVFIDVYLPAMMHGGVTLPDWAWLRIFAALDEGVDPHQMRARLAPVVHAFQKDRMQHWHVTSNEAIDRFLNQALLLTPTPAGTSSLQSNYRPALIAIGVLVALVLLIACANVANLMSAQAAARSREMALRVSIGAGRGRLIQLVLAESVLLALLATAVGGLFAWKAAPLVVSLINPPDAPARLPLPADWRVTVFATLLALGVTCLIGLAPALSASSSEPSKALKGDADPKTKRRLAYGLIAVQTAFCFVVTMAAGLFLGSLTRLTSQPMGFDPEGVLLLTANAPSSPSSAVWEQMTDVVRAEPGVEHAGLSRWPLLWGNGWAGFVWVDNEPTEVLSYLLGVSPHWTEAMGIRLLEGRDLRPGEADRALVNESFMRDCFDGRSPVGRWFERGFPGADKRTRFQIVGVVEDARYQDLREPPKPTAYVPMFELGPDGKEQTQSTAILTIRTKGPGDPTAMSPALRAKVEKERPEFEITNVRTQHELIELRTIRERLLAGLGAFFSAVAVLLAGVGLYGALARSVVQRRREIGIRRAVGADASGIVWSLTARAAGMALLGVALGAGLSLALAGQVEALLYRVRPTDATMLVPTLLTIFAIAAVAACPAVVRAIRIDPAAILRSE